MKYTQNYNLRKPEDTDPADIQDLNYNADVIDSKIKEIEDWEAAHLQASNPHSITPALIGAETPTGAQQKANQAETNAKSYADIVTNSALNSAKDYADDVLESANSHTDQVASDLSQKLNETRIKVLDVEQDVSNISKVLTSLNPSQEAKQSVSGYGILSLPKNAANGQVSVSVKGETRTNLVKSSNMDKDTNGDGVVDDFNVWKPSDVTSIISFDTEKKAQKIEITGGTGTTHTEIYQYILGFNTGDVISGQCNIELTGNISARLALLYYKDSTILGAASSTEVVNSGILKIENVTVLENTNRILFAIRINPNSIGATGTAWIKNAVLEKSNVSREYISTGTKSTISASRLKSVGKNLVPKNTNIPRFAIIEGRECIQPQYSDNFTSIQSEGVFYAISTNVFHKYANIKFKPNTQYTLQLRTQNLGTNTGYRIIHTDGSHISGSTVSDFALNTVTSTIGKTVLAIVFYHGTWGQNTAVDLDSIMLNEGNVALPYEPYTESTQYIPNVGELRSLPNGTKDEIRVSGGKAELVKRVKEYVLQASDIINSTGGVNIDIWYIKKPTDYIGYNNTSQYGIKSIVLEGYNTSTYADDLTKIGTVYDSSYAAIGLIVPKGTYSTIEQARTALTGLTLTYQLAEPIITPIEVSGNLISYPSGTVYVENVVADAGIYTDKMAILHQDLPIKVLEKLSKIDFTTGLETELDITAAVIAEDKLSFTHPDLVDGDIVFFTYEYDRESTEGEIEIEYYDSRHVIKDSVTGKFYKWHIAVADGVPSIELTEV